MMISKQSVRVVVVIAIGLAFLLLALTPLALAGETATPKETIQAAQTSGVATVIAARTGIPLTITAFKATAQSAQNNFRATGTAYKAVATSLAATAAVVRATLNAGATRVNATVIAARTEITTRAAPLADPATAIDYYATNILGITVKVQAVRQGASADASGLTQVDAGAQLQRSAGLWAGVNDYAVLSNGVASLSYGLGVVRDEKLDAALVSGSVAVYSLTVKKAGPLDAATALALAQATFPKLSRLAYQVYSTQRGWAWLAPQSEGLADTRTVKSGPGWVLLFVVPSASGDAVVSITVVLGGFLPLAPR